MKKYFLILRKSYFYVRKASLGVWNSWSAFPLNWNYSKALDFDSSHQRRILRQSEGKDGARQIWQWCYNSHFSPDNLKDSLYSLLKNQPQELNWNNNTDTYEIVSSIKQKHSLATLPAWLVSHPAKEFPEASLKCPRWKLSPYREAFCFL